MMIQNGISFTLVSIHGFQWFQLTKYRDVQSVQWGETGTHASETTSAGLRLRGNSVKKALSGKDF